LEQLKEQKNVFKNTHQELTQLTSANDDNEAANMNQEHDPQQTVQSLKQDCRQLSTEKEQLTEKLGKMKEKAEAESTRFDDGKTRFAQLLQSTSTLRKYQEEEAMLFERGDEQRRELNMNAKHLQSLLSKRNHLQSIVNDDNEDMVNALQRKLTEQRVILGKLDEEYSENEQLLNEALSIINSGDRVSEQDIEQLENEVAEQQSEIAELEKQRDKILSSMDEKLSFYKKRAQSVQKKKEAAQQRLKQGKREMRDLRDDMIKLDEQMDSLHINGQRPMSESQLKQYMQMLRDKTEKYKQYKTQIQSQRNELSILQRSNEILRARDVDLTEYEQRKEREQELREQRSELERVSAAKNELDVEKANKLTNIAEVVSKINYSLQIKKFKLQPLVQRLKESRAKFKEFEEKYLEKKRIYHNLRIPYDSELSKLQESIDSMANIVNNLETRYYRMLTEIEMNEIRLEKAKQEERCQSGQETLDKQFKCYRDLYEAEIEKLLHLSKTLKSEQETVRAGHNDNVRQKQYFGYLLEMMQIKLEGVEQRVNKLAELNAYTNEKDNEDGDRLTLV